MSVLTHIKPRGEVGWNCYQRFFMPFCVSRRVRTWKKPSWWWPESCWLVTALTSSRGTSRATTHLEFSSGQTLGRLMASWLPTHHQRRSHAADSKVDWTRKMKDWKLKVDSGRFPLWILEIPTECRNLRRSKEGCGIWPCNYWKVLKNQFSVLLCDLPDLKDCKTWAVFSPPIIILSTHCCYYSIFFFLSLHYQK